MLKELLENHNPYYIDDTMVFGDYEGEMQVAAWRKGATFMAEYILEQIKKGINDAEKFVNDDFNMDKLDENAVAYLAKGKQIALGEIMAKLM